jgi:glutathione S-transferase
MKLYYSPRACSLAARIAFHELGIQPDYERVDLRTKITETGRDFRQVNPLGYVPALELDDGTVITENVAILPYIADMRGGEIAPLPASFDRVRLIEALGFLSGELHKSFSPFIAGVEGSAREKATARLESRLDHVERRLADGRDYLVGNRYSVADAYAFVILSWCPLLGFPLDRWPHIRVYIECINSRFAVQAAIAQELAQTTA